MLKPYRQGGLDSLCGLYAIVNAVRWGLRDLAPLTLPSSQHLLAALTTALDERRMLNSAMLEGMSMPDLSRSLKIAQEWLAEELGIVAVVRKPFHKNGTAKLAAFMASIDAHLQGSNTAVIVVSTGRSDHWSVITHVDRRVIRVFDSDGSHWFRTNTCICAPMTAIDVTRLQFVPSGLYTLRFEHSG